MASRLPQPPLGQTATQIHRSLTDTISFLRETYDQGSKHQAFTQAQIDSFTSKQFLGTILFNSSTNSSNVSFLNTSGDVEWREV